MPRKGIYIYIRMEHEVMPNTVKVSVTMEITVYQSSILVEYCDLKYFHCIPVSHGFLFCCIFRVSYPVL